MNRQKILITVVVVLAVIGTGAWFWYNQNHLLLQSVVPKNRSTQATTVDPVTFTFNKALDAATIKNFTIQPTVAGSLTVKGKQLIFSPSTPYAFNTTYTVVITQATSTDGKSLGNIRTVFKPGYVNNPSKDQLQTQLNRTDSAENTYPILKSIPHETLDYKIDYRMSENKLILQITLYAILNRPDQAADYQKQLKDYKTEALDYLHSIHEDPASYQIEYEPSEAASL